MPHPNITGTSIILTGDGTVSTPSCKIHSITIQWATGSPTQNIVYLRGAGIIRWEARHASVANPGDVSEHFTFPAGMALEGPVTVDVNVAEIVTTTVFAP